MKARNVLKEVIADPVAENGGVKSRRRIWRHLVKEVSITAIVGGIVDAADVDGEVTEEEATVEMASQDEDVVDIAEEVMHKPLCSNNVLSSNGQLRDGCKRKREGAFLALYQKLLTTNLLFRIRVKSCIFSVSVAFSSSLC